MCWCPTVSTSAERPSPLASVHPFRSLKRFLPRSLFGRSLIIIVAPVVILQAIVTDIFFERHYDVVTGRLATSVARDIGYLVRLERSLPPGPEREKMRQLAISSFAYTVEVQPGEHLRKSVSAPADPLDRQLLRVFSSEINQDISFDSRRYPNYVEIRVQMSDGVLRLLIPRRRFEAPSADIFLFWMVGSALVLLAVAILFLRNQVKPIERLAFAAESFGKGRSIPDFKPHGATEIRRASQAFIEMRERIERYVQQRTEMLAGVSHDLKTPLTRMRLQLAMMPKNSDSEAMQSDVVEMEKMLNEYLDFARGESGEDAEPTDLAALVDEAVQDVVRARDPSAARLKLTITPNITLTLKRNAMKRCIVNLVDNALKYGRHVDVSLGLQGRNVELLVDDDGPGIPEPRREEAFRPFHRLDEGRNLQTGGVGLGLAIARDIARAHGGEIELSASPQGGLRAALHLPL